MNKSIKTIDLSIQTMSGESLSESAALEIEMPEASNDKLTQQKTNYLVHRCFQTQRINSYQGNVATKTRAEVRGGGKKPWKQKGTGRARAGSSRSPLWKGGGVIFGPKPKSYSLKINRKEWRLGLKSLLAQRSEQMVVLDKLQFNSPKTKEAIGLFNALKIKSAEKILMIVSKIDNNLFLSTRNMSNVTIMEANKLNFNKILLSNLIILDTPSLQIINQTYK